MEEHSISINNRYHTPVRQAENTIPCPERSQAITDKIQELARRPGRNQAFWAKVLAGMEGKR